MGTLSKLSKYGILDIEEMKRLILRLSAALCLIIPVSTISIFLFLALGTTTEPLGTTGYGITYPSPFIVFGVIAFLSFVGGLVMIGDVISLLRAKLKLLRFLKEGAEIECLIQALKYTTNPNETCRWGGTGSRFGCSKRSGKSSW